MKLFADVGADLRFAVRMLRKSAVTTVMIVACLGFSVGAVGTVFAWTETIVYGPLPAVPDVGRIASLKTVTRDGQTYVSYPDFRDARATDSTAASPAFSELAASGIRRFSLRADVRADAHSAEPIWGALTTANYFNALRVRLELGPGMRPGDDLLGSGLPVAVISHALWQRRFGGAMDVIGRHVLINTREFAIVGVAPKDFVGNVARLALDIWVPVTMQPDLVGGRDLLDRRDVRWLDVIGRMRPGVSLAAARLATEATGRTLAARYPADRNLGLTARTLDVGPVERMAPLFTVMLGIAVLVVLIVCSNIANLLLLRGAAREHEMAVRLAMGARPGCVVRQLMIENLLLALAGIVVGIGVLALARNALDMLTPASPLPIVAETPINLDALLVIAAVGVGTIFVFGLAPALRAARTAVRASLTGSGSTRGGSAGSGRVRGALVSAQFALSLAVLVTAGLFLRRLDELQRVDRGFRDPEQVLLVTLDFELAGIRSDSMQTLALERVIDQLSRQPGVRSASAASFVPLGFLGYNSAKTSVDGYTSGPGESTDFLINRVFGGYFATMDIPIVRGRPIAMSDRAGAEPVAVVNAAFARRFFGAANPIGRRIRVNGSETTVVGVAADGKYVFTAPLDEPSPPFIYLPFPQWPTSSVVLHVRADGDPLTLVPAVERVVTSVEPRLIAMSPSTLESYSSVPYLPIRLGTRILSVLGAGALILATLGLYAVIGFAVTQRRREIGIRMALGATPRSLIVHFLAYAVRYAGAGAIAGAALATAIAWGLATRLPGSVPRTMNEMALPFATAIALLGAVAALAAIIPANRAARVNPTAALRED